MIRSRGENNNNERSFICIIYYANGKNVVESSVRLERLLLLIIIGLSLIKSFDNDHAL